MRRPLALLSAALLVLTGCAGPSAAPGVETPTSEATPSPTPYDPIFPAGATVAFFGDSQATLLLRDDRRPPWVAQYLNPVDQSIEGCGILLGKVKSRSGESRNLATDYRCQDWPATWDARIHDGDPPDLSIIMIGAWEVMDLTLPDGEFVGFGTPRWDETFDAALAQAIATLRAVDRPVALALASCYRPVTSSRGTGSGYWPERGDDDRTRHINDRLIAAVANYPTGVFTLDPPAEFCDDPVIAHASHFRGDGIHVTPCGANLYFETYVRQLTGLDPGPDLPAGSHWDCELPSRDLGVSNTS